MKLPKSLKIGYKNYKITETMPNETLIMNCDECAGKIYFVEEKIEIHKNTPHKLKTLLHELLHGICDMEQLNELNDDEDSIDRLASGLYKLIKDNNIKIKF